MATLTIGKWGNASGIRLPKPFCETLGIKVGDDVDVSIEDNRRIVIEPTHNEYSLEARMAQWDGKRYKSQELDWGEPAGDEIW